MPKYTAEINGEVYEFEAENDEQAAESAQLLSTELAPQPTYFDNVKQNAADLGSYAGRQLGLAGRAAVEGVTSIPAAGASAIGAGLNKAVGALGGPDDYFNQDYGADVSDALTQVGVPVPRGTAEEYGNLAGQAIAAGVPVVKGAQLISQAASNPTVKGVFDTIYRAPGAEASGSVGAVLAGQAAGDMGASPAGQFGASVVGAGLAPSSIVAGNTVRGAARTAGAFTEGGQRRIVGDALNEQATNPLTAQGNLQRNALTEQSTGALSEDIGLLSLERSLRSRDTTGAFATQTQQANAKRQRILDELRGEPVETTRARRDAEGDTAREGALSQSDGQGINLAPIQSTINDIATSPAGKRKLIRTVAEDYSERVGEATNARELYEIRKDLRADIQGKTEGKKDYRFATRELIKIREAIDKQIEDVAPGFTKYLDDYAKLSRDIDQRTAIGDIQDKATVAQPLAGGEPLLSQAKFSRMVNKERAAGTLTDDQVNVLTQIARDLDMGGAVNSQGVKPVGSNTARDLTVANVLGSIGAGNSTLARTLIRPIEWISKKPEEDIQALLIDAMLDPALARQLMKDATPKNMQEISLRLKDRAGAAFVGAPAAQPILEPQS